MTEGIQQHNEFEGIWHKPGCEEVYLLRGADGFAYKIGISKNPIQRSIDLKESGYPFDIEIVATYKTIMAREVEQQFHNDFRFIRAHLESFCPFGAQGLTEWFSLPKVFEARFGEACEEIERRLIKACSFVPNAVRVRMRDFSVTTKIFHP